METKKIFLIIFVFSTISGCTDKTAIKVDLDAEKMKIQRIIDENGAVLRNNDRNAAISFLRNYNMAEFLFISKDTIIDVNYGKMSNEELANEFLPTNGKYVTIEPITSIIKISPDAKLAYAIGKIKLEYESTDMKRNKNTVTYLQVFQKNDSIWQMSDIMQVFK